jgi:hypothetical protein
MGASSMDRHAREPQQGAVSAMIRATRAIRAASTLGARGRAFVDDCPRWQGDKRQRHCLAEVPPFRRIVTFRVAEPEWVNGYSDPARYLPDLVDGECLLLLKHQRPRR